MKKLWFTLIAIVMLFSLVIIVVFNFPALLISNTKAQFAEIHYHFPKGFNGCGFVLYNVEGARPLEIRDAGVLHHYFDHEGVSLTSSQQKFGWANEETSGSYKSYYFIGGERLPIEQHIPSAVGEGGFPEGGYVEYEVHAFQDSMDCHGLLDDVIKRYQDRLTTK